MKDGKFTNWAELPSDLISSILLRLSVAERLQNAGQVCRSWRCAIQDPSMWRRIDVDVCYRGIIEESMARTKFTRRAKITIPSHLAHALCRRAVDLSQNGVLEINILDFATDSLLSYIADRSSNLKRLGLVKCDQVTGVGLLEAVTRLPLLEHLEVSSSYIKELDLRALGLSCPNLKALKLNDVGSYYYKGNECDEDALAIAQTMPGLRHLHLTGNRLSNAGFNAILENCLSLERIDLRRCPYVNFG